MRKYQALSIVWMILALCTEAPLMAGSSPKTLEISCTKYADQLHGFWLGQSIANWTGIVTEMVRTSPPFYTDEDWGKPAEPSVWGFYAPHTSRIDYYLTEKGKVWGADDDTDIEYMYQHLLSTHQTSILTAAQIRNGWLKHIYTNETAPISPILFERENFLWVSNERALYLMKDDGLLPPATSEPEHNDTYDMIDAQLTTEIFGLFAPSRPDIALKMAHIPIRTTAKGEAESIAEFYVTMHALASIVDVKLPVKNQVFWLALEARKHLQENSYPAKMFDFVFSSYTQNPDKTNWEKTRDAIFTRYQKSQHDGYIYKQPYDAGINFAASLISLFYGEGDFLKTIKIGTLAGWDSDNPTATWGGLLGFMLGKDSIQQVFPEANLSEAYWIHRTRRDFPDHTPSEDGEDSFSLMAARGLNIIDRVVTNEMDGKLDAHRNVWIIPTITQN